MIMKKLSLALAITTMVATAPALADTVNPANVTTFQGGTPAVASQVNGTVQELISAINDNATRIAAIENAETSLVPGDITGNLYCFFSLSTGVGAGDPGLDGVGSWVGASSGRSQGSLTFTSTTEGTLNIAVDSFQEALSPTYAMFDASDGAGSEAITYTLVNNTLTITYTAEGDSDVMFMSPDGNTILFGISELERSSDNSGNWFLADLVIGMRAMSCP